MKVTSATPVSDDFSNQSGPEVVSIISMQKVLLIGLAGLVGTVGRYALSGVIARRFGETFPAGTLIVNIVGCFLAGLLFYLLQERNLVGPTTRAVVMIGFL